MLNVGVVRSEGLEPPRFYSLPPQGSASTNSATSAWETGLPLFAVRPINGADVTNRDWGYKARDGFESVEIWTGSGLIWYQASAAASA